ncbi:unnamed protein product [Dibothriocephalus latus]|uniref:Uncharacterized protein n=1 Tax=Dibothriocephalus latus TaxID=60516 RepID=A0A3P7M514_DIBLA|nr:unnamed protein product [Dibothriocephalus latus]
MLGASLSDAHPRLRKFQSSEDQRMQFCRDKIPLELFKSLGAMIAHASEHERQMKGTKTEKNEKASGRVVNLSSRAFTTAEENVLSRGMKYNFSDSNHLEILAKLETIVSTTNLIENEQFTIRDKFTQALNNRNQFSPLFHEEKKTLKTLRSNKTIVVVPADK